ncbi:MAG: ParA family protein [Candidatus Krumholzibacteria bacterium]|nr:ParA family protein [Candidatus Krumholzibacteria bacterium]
MRKFAVMTMKGGTGKTTTAVNVAHGLSLSGCKVLLIDCDPQRSVVVTFGVNCQKGLAQLLTSGDVEILQVRDNLFLIDSGGRRLADVELILGRKENRENRLAESLRFLKGCDFVICDCSPSINLININALVYCDEVIIPIAMDNLSQVGARQTLEIIEEVLELTNRNSMSFRILPTFYDARTRISKRVLEQVREHFGDRVFRTVIRVSTALCEAPGFNKTIYEHDPLSRGAFDYYHLTEEILGFTKIFEADRRGGC